MSVLRKIIYLIIFSVWTDVMIAHSLGVDQITITRVRRWLNDYRNKFNIIISMDDDELEVMFSEFYEHKVWEDAVIYQFKTLQTSQKGISSYE